MPALPSGTVTFLFSDIEGSPAILRRLGDLSYTRLLSAYRRLVRTVISEGSGIEIDTRGDAFFVVFERARQALASAVALQRAVSTFPWPGETSVRVRVGLHTAEAIATETAYVGLDVHRAARICAAGHGAQILLSQTTYNLINTAAPALGLDLRNLGEHRLKDLQRPERLYQVLHTDLPDVRTPLRSLSVLPNNLPLQMTPFIGRERETADLKQLLTTRRLVTLTGFGGCGKTRLALHVAADVMEEYPDGVWLADLAEVSDPAVVPQVVASALSVREEPGRLLTATLADQLQEKRLLLVLDNCEHVIAACAPLVQSLLAGAPHLRILATSRESLDVPGETIWRVPTLTLPDLQARSASDLLQNEAVRLFAERAVAVQPAFAMNDRTAAVVSQICRRLEGIPLAIELAAAQVRVLTLTEVAARLEDGLRMLPARRRTAPRHQTLQAVMEWSYAQLTEAERTLLRRLSVFTGSFTLQAAEVICAGDGVAPAAVLELLGRLVDKSLVLVDQQTGESRFHLLETVRRYSGEKLRENGEAHAVRRRHADWYLALVRQAEPMLQVSQEWLDRLEADHPNLRGVMDWYRQTEGYEQALTLSTALLRFWLVRGLWAEGRRWLEDALRGAPDAPPALRAKALRAAAAIAQYQADYDHALALCEESLALYRTLGDQKGIAEALSTYGNVLFERGEYPAARGVHEESLAYGRHAGDEWLIGASLLNLASVLMHQGDFDRAQALCQEGLAVFRQAGDRRGVAYALNLLGLIARDQGDFVGARKPFEESLAIQQQLGDKRGIAIALTNLGLLAWELGNDTAAVRLYEEALAIRRELGDRRGVATLLYDLGQVALRQGDEQRATALFSESLVMRHAARNRTGVSQSLEGLARAARRDYQRAAILFGAAAAIQEAVGETRSRSEQIEYERARDEIQAALGEGPFRAAWQVGNTMTLAQAVEYALASGPVVETYPPSPST